MLQWQTDTYVTVAGDAALARFVRLITPAGVLHSPDVSGQRSREERWLVHYLEARVTQDPDDERQYGGVVGQLVLATDMPAVLVPINTPNHGISHPEYGIRYEGPPFEARRGAGVLFRKGAIAASYYVRLTIGYEVLP